MVNFGILPHYSALSHVVQVPVPRPCPADFRPIEKRAHIATCKQACVSKWVLFPALLNIFASLGFEPRSTSAHIVRPCPTGIRLIE